MSHPDRPAKGPPERTFECFEQRLAFSAHAIADPALTPQVQSPELEALAHLQQQAALVTTQNHLAPVNQVLADYGFKGSGQTVAVIDSGIAWDHYALGGGFGAGHRVVGGWDFAENDANPYDDGSAGFHGTHVSGIIGSSDATHKGVASGVDLVGLRVFNDAGQGNLAWVEQALQWVHQNRNSFANPITTVNLSLGSAWNADNVPNWATLEDEFAQLKADGIFISVAAGNSFQTYNAAGLSYPAVSEHVVPVASHNADGGMSNFSQRNSRVLVAPGESIRSTVPDHLFGGSRTGQFLGASGTSMAAPWVAGASTLLREAYDFMGQSSVNQSQLYQTFRDSADQIYDAVTGGWYSRVNLEKAIASIVTDAHGDTALTATRLGSIQGGVEVEGVIGKKSDVDSFSFTAGRTGRMTLTFETTHDLQARVQLAGNNLQWSGNSVSFDVVAGQEYNFAVSTADGIGHYRMTAEIRGAVATDWGLVQDNLRTGVAVNGPTLYQIQAGQSGLLTVSGLASSGQVSLRILDQNMQEIHAGPMGSAGSRIDFEAAAGEKFYIQLNGTGTVDLRTTNLISLDSGRLAIHGTAGNDRIQIQTGGEWSVEINGMAYRFAGSEVQQVLLNGNGQSDRLELRLADGNHQVQIQNGTVWCGGSGFTLSASSIETAVVHAGTGTNHLFLGGTASVDRLSNSGNMVSLTGGGWAAHGVGFTSVHADGRGGADQADLQGTQGADRLGAGTGWLQMTAGTTNLLAVQYEQIRFAGGAGTDHVNLHGSSGDDQFTIGNYHGSARIGNVQVEISGAESIHAFGRGGTDRVTWRDTAGNDSLFAGGRTSFIAGGGFSGYAEGMSVIEASSSSGNDLAQMADTAGSDQAWMTHQQTILVSSLSRITATGFARTNLVSSHGGADVVQMTGTAGNDRIYSIAGATSMETAWGRLNRAVGFSSVVVDGWAGSDTAWIEGSQGLDRLSASGETIQLTRSQGGNLQISQVSGVTFDGRGAADEVVFSGLGNGDQLQGAGNSALATWSGRSLEARNFALLSARAAAGEIATQSLSAVDYLFMLSGGWQPRY